MAASTGARLQRKAARTAVSAAPDPSIRRCYGSCYRSKTFRAGCKRLGLRQIFTKRYTPRTNGKAERFIQTSLREWAYARAYNTSDERTAELPRWLHRYNWHRPHGSIGSKPPISRLGLAQNNLLRLHS